jgi:thiamine biosynthesis lipoprotein
VIDSSARSAIVMDTIVSIRIVGSDDSRASARAVEWFHRIERVCSRFDPASEVMRLTERIGKRVEVSEILFETTRFALAVAAETNGAFDPTVGYHMERRGYNREYMSGAVIDSRLEGHEDATFRDVIVDEASRTIALLPPIVLDLGAVAKGFAVDLAARELRAAGHENFAIDAGGDLYLGGLNDDGEQWSVGIRNPQNEDEPIDTVVVSNAAVCTSGNYVRGAHILDANARTPVDSLASATVIAPLAMVADALATAAFVLGPSRGLKLNERHGAQGVLVTPSLELLRTE